MCFKIFHEFPRLKYVFNNLSIWDTRTDETCHRDHKKFKKFTNFKEIPENQLMDYMNGVASVKYLMDESKFEIINNKIIPTVSGGRKIGEKFKQT